MNAASVGLLLQKLDSPEAQVKYRASRSLRELSEKTPAALYPWYDSFVRRMAHENSFMRWDACRTVASLAAAASEAQVESVLDLVLAPISGPQVVGAATAIASAAKIALAKPVFAPRIAAAILKVRTARYKTPECRNIAIGHAIQNLARLVGLLNDPEPVLEFVRGQTTNPRNATRVKAERFLRAYGRR